MVACPEAPKYSIVGRQSTVNESTTHLFGKLCGGTHTDVDNRAVRLACQPAVQVSRNGLLRSQEDQRSASWARRVRVLKPHGHRQYRRYTALIHGILQLMIVFITQSKSMDSK